LTHLKAQGYLDSSSMVRLVADAADQVIW